MGAVSRQCDNGVRVVVVTRPRHCAQALYITRYIGTIIWVDFFIQILSTRSLPIHPKIGAQSLKVTNLKHILLYCCLKDILLLLHTLQVITSSRLLSHIYLFDELFNRSAKSLDMQALPRASLGVNVGKPSQ